MDLNIRDIVSEVLSEQNERENRKLNDVCFGMKEIGLARLIKILDNRSIYNIKTIIDMKIKKLVTSNGCSVPLFNKN